MLRIANQFKGKMGKRPTLFVVIKFLLLFFKEQKPSGYISSYEMYIFELRCHLKLPRFIAYTELMLNEIARVLKKYITMKAKESFN